MRGGRHRVLGWMYDAPYKGGDASAPDQNNRCGTSVLFALESKEPHRLDSEVRQYAEDLHDNYTRLIRKTTSASRR